MEVSLDKNKSARANGRSLLRKTIDFRSRSILLLYGFHYPPIRMFTLIARAICPETYRLIGSACRVGGLICWTTKRNPRSLVSRYYAEIRLYKPFIHLCLLLI